MADPWSSDLAALGEHSWRNLRTLDATRAALAQHPQETRMRFFKSHPALAALIALAFLAAAAPIAYAVVRDVWVSIDPDKPASEIEKDVQSQLEAAGVQGTVRAEKSDGQLKVSIQHVGSNADDIGSALHVSVAGKEAVGQVQRTVRFEMACELDEAQMQRLTDLMSGPEMVGVLAKDFDSDYDRKTAIAGVLAAHGFKGAEITVDADSIDIKITAPPT